MGLSRPLSASWLAMRLRLRFSLERSLSKTSPERRAETRSSNSPPSSPLSFAFLALRSRSRCSFSYMPLRGPGGKETTHSHAGGCGGAQHKRGDPQTHETRAVSHPSAYHMRAGEGYRYNPWAEVHSPMAAAGGSQQSTRSTSSAARFSSKISPTQGH